MEFKKGRWNLKDLMGGVNTSKHKEMLREIEKYTKLIEDSKKELNNINAKRFFEILKYSEKLNELISVLGGYGSLWFSEDVNSPEAKAFISDIEQLGVNISNRTLFFDLWFKSLDDKTANKLIEGVPQEYRYHLKLARATRKYVLSEKEESIINIKDSTGINALDKLYSILTNKFVFNLKVKGKLLKLNREQLTEYIKNHDRNLRKAAYDELFRVFSNEKEIITEIYRSNVLDTKNEDLRLRGYKSPIAIRNISNDIDDEVVDLLLDTCRENRTVFQKYFKIKTKILKLDKMTRYDLYAPVKEKKEKIPYSEGTKLVFDAYDKFSPKIGELARNIFVKKHIDSEVRANKSNGAFCYSTTPKITPYVLLSYNDNIENVSTLAHEIGHAIHSQLANKHNIFSYHATLPLCETASVFGESLLYDHLTSLNKYKKLKQSLIMKRIDDFYATIMRQAYFVMFEKKAHNLVMEGKTSDDLNEAYLANLKEQFGNSIVIPENFKYEWNAIPHLFHSPFYCYAYSFGNLLVMSLYNRYKKEGKGFVNDYNTILAAGSSDSPKNILRKAEIDIKSKKFWQSGFNVINDLVDDLESFK